MTETRAARPRTLLVTAAEMREIETDAVTRGATWPGLMDTAGEMVARATIDWLGPKSTQRMLVLSGPGNNGGDGLVVAHHVFDHGWQVRCLTWKRAAEVGDRLLKPLVERSVPVEPLSEDVARRETQLGEALRWCTVVVDALLGTGLQRAVEGDLAGVVQTVAEAGRAVVAVDIATGVNSDTGSVLGAALPAQLTVTLGSHKFGHFVYPGKKYGGRVLLEDIGLDATKSRETASGTLLTEDYVRGLLPERPLDSNKGTFGKAFVVAGSVNYIGAAALAVQGAMRTGAGLVTLGCPGDLLMILAAKLTECTFVPLPSDLGALSLHAADKLLPALDGYKALLVGCGLGTEKETERFVRSLFAKSEVIAHPSSRPIGFAARVALSEDAKEENRALPSLVLDGDALNILAEWGDWKGAVPAGSVFTPHPGEMARLTGRTIEEVQEDRVGVAKATAADWGQVVVLKGAGTVIAEPSGKAFVSPFANPVLATAGSGDVLAGAITGLIAQGVAPVDAACAGVYLHGLAGESLAEEYGPAGGLAGELPALMAKAQKRVRGK